MKLFNIKSLLLGSVLAVGAATLPVVSASAQTTTAPQTTAPQTGTAPETTIPSTTTTNNVDSEDDGFDWGWLGLLGLIGLAGLAGRKSDDRTQYRSDSTVDPAVTTRSDYRR